MEIHAILTKLDCLFDRNRIDFLFLAILHEAPGSLTSRCLKSLGPSTDSSQSYFLQESLPKLPMTFWNNFLKPVEKVRNSHFYPMVDLMGEYNEANIVLRYVFPVFLLNRCILLWGVLRSPQASIRDGGFRSHGISRYVSRSCSSVYLP